MEEAQITKVPRQPQTVFLGAQLFLRVVATGAALAGVGLMVTNDQTAPVAGNPMRAKWSYSDEFKFMVVTNIIAAVFTLLSCIHLLVIVPRGSNPIRLFILFLHDLIMMSLVLAGVAAATAIGEIGKHGNMQSGWMPICTIEVKFCNRATSSIALTYLALICLFLLTISSAVKSVQISVNN